MVKKVDEKYKEMKMEAQAQTKNLQKWGWNWWTRKKYKFMKDNFLTNVNGIV